jgi:hypothetical protein
MSKFGDLQTTKALLLIGSLLIGLSFAALLPPFEGFDEIAHYSYIEQIAETGRWPRLNGPIAQEVTDYLDAAPGPTTSLQGRWSYRAFFAAPPETVARARAIVHTPRDPSRPWQPGAGSNYEGQHPPLYYALLAPVFNLSMGWSFERQFLLLRGLSYLIGWISLCIVTFLPSVNLQKDRRVKTAMALAPALWPALFPMWFTEMGRLGNDCLVTLWAACAAVLILRLSLKDGLFNYVLLGIVCAFGLLTKATFLPLTAAIFFFLCYRTWTARGDKPQFRQFARGLAAFVAIVIVISGWWYGKNLYDTGSLIGSKDELQQLALDHRLSVKGNLVSLALEKLQTIPPRALVSGLIGSNLLDFVWGGTWSFVLPPLLSELPLIILVFVIVVGYLRAVVRTPPSGSEWIYPLTLAFFLAGLFHDLLIVFAVLGTISIGVHYLHSLAPILAPMVGRGVAEVCRWRATRPFVGAILLYPSLFLPFGTGVLALYYAGCGDKYADHAFYNFSSAQSCILDVTGIIHNLSVLGDPWLSITLFIFGWTLMLIGMILSIRVLLVDGRELSAKAVAESHSGGAYI